MVTDRQTTSQEDRTEVLLEEEATSTKPAPEGTEIPLCIINSTHYNQDKANHIHESFALQGITINFNKFLK